MPILSVFMPCYNAEKYVADAVKSILNQTFTDFELVIVNDGSTDNSLEIIKRLGKTDSRIRLINNPKNMGIAYTRNLGLKECKGTYVALMDSDDVAIANRFEREIEFLKMHKDISVVCGSYLLIDEEGNEIGNCFLDELLPEIVKVKMFFENVVANGTVMYRREDIGLLNLQYKDNYCGLEDYHFWCDVLKKNKISLLPEYFMKYRVVQSGLSRQHADKKKALREKCFDEIHNDYLAQNNISLSDSRRKLYLEKTRENKRFLGVGKRIQWILFLNSFYKMFSADMRKNMKKECLKRIIM